MKPTPTRIYTASDISGAITIRDCIDAVDLAFARQADSRMTVPPVVHIPARGGAFHVKSAAFDDEPHYVAVKVNGNFPANPDTHGLPTIQGAIILCDARNGAVLAVMDSGHVTAIRTAAATAVAARHLARGDAQTALLVGCGAQGEIQLRAVLEVLPLRQVFVSDRNFARAQRLAEAIERETSCGVRPVADFTAVSRDCGAIVTCTTSRSALLDLDQVAPGTFIAAVGADNHDKQEIAPRLMAAARVVVDNLDQCAEIGDLHHAIAAGMMTAADVAADLGSVITGKAELERAPDDIVVFDSTGVAIQDVAVAGAIYERAQDLGLRVELSR